MPQCAVNSGAATARLNYGRRPWRLVCGWGCNLKLHHCLRKRCVLSVEWKREVVIDSESGGSDMCKVMRRWKTKMWMRLKERMRTHDTRWVPFNMGRSAANHQGNVRVFRHIWRVVPYGMWFPVAMWWSSFTNCYISFTYLLTCGVVAVAAVLDYLNVQNRPYSAIDVFNNLHKEYGKVVIYAILT